MSAASPSNGRASETFVATDGIAKGVVTATHAGHTRALLESLASLVVGKTSRWDDSTWWRLTAVPTDCARIEDARWRAVLLETRGGWRGLAL
jgi:hypothetical protein